MGVGKSTLAAALARDRGWVMSDSDTDIEALFGQSGAAIAAAGGVDVLHRLEAAVLLGALAGDEPRVIAAAASIVEDEWCVRALRRRAFVVVLSAELDVVLARMETGRHRRDMSASELTELAARRARSFEQVADLTLDATSPPATLVAEVTRGVG